jgi:hypothetical protein
MAATVESCTCGAHFEPHAASKTKCPECASTRIRVLRVLKKHPSLEGCFDSLDKDNFLQNCKTLFGDDIAKSCHTELREHRSVESVVEMVGTGAWLDEEDLAKKYANKPNRLAAILRNTRRFNCPISETELFEDMEYCTKNTDKSLKRRELDIDMEVTHTIKRQKVPKAPKAEQAEQPGEGEPDGKPLTAAQEKQIPKMIEDLQKAETSLKAISEPMGQNQKLASMVPEWSKHKVNVALAQAMQAMAALEITADSKKGDFASMKTNHKEAKDLVKHAKAKLVVQIQEANAEIGA